jgi:hypothetical protein
VVAVLANGAAADTGGAEGGFDGGDRAGRAGARDRSGLVGCSAVSDAPTYASTPKRVVKEDAMAGQDNGTVVPAWLGPDKLFVPAKG